MMYAGQNELFFEKLKPYFDAFLAEDADSVYAEWKNCPNRKAVAFLNDELCWAYLSVSYADGLFILALVTDKKLSSRKSFLEHVKELYHPIYYTYKVSDPYKNNSTSVNERIKRLF